MASCPGLCPADFSITPNKWVPKYADFMVDTCRTFGFWITQEGIACFYMAVTPYVSVHVKNIAEV